MAWAGDWNELGIAPTDDAASIRRAYALRLRSTRPDDDAVAYQRLREAYDRQLKRAIARARSEAAQAAAVEVVESGGEAEEEESRAQVEAGAEVEVLDLAAALVPAPASAPASSLTESPLLPPRPPPTFSFAPPPPPATPPPAFVFAPLPPPWGGPTAATVFVPAAEAPAPPPIGASDTAQGLADEFAALVSAGAAAEAWPGLQARLDALPLSANDKAALAFADVVLENDRVPAAVLLGLRQHFAWTSDFRQARLLGHERSRRLQELLDEKAPEPITDGELLGKHRHLIWFSRLVAGHADLRAALLGIAVGRPMRTVLRFADAATLRRLGIGPVAALEERLKGAAVWRAFLLLGLLGAVGALLGADGAGVWKGLTSTVMSMALIFAVGRPLLGRLRRLLAQILPLTLQARLAAWRVDTSMPLLASLLLAAAGCAFAIATDRSPWASWLCVYAGGLCVGLAWPREADHVLLSAALLVLLEVGFASQLDDRGGFAMGLIVIAWCFLCAWLFEHGRHRYRSRWLTTWRLGMQRSPGLELLLILPGFPYYLFSSAKVCGLDVVIASLGAALALTLMPITPWLRDWSLLALPLVFLFLLGLQDSAVGWADAARARAARVPAR